MVVVEEADHGGNFPLWETVGSEVWKHFPDLDQSGDGRALGRLTAPFPSPLCACVVLTRMLFWSVGGSKREKTGSSFVSRQPTARATSRRLKVF